MHRKHSPIFYVLLVGIAALFSAAGCTSNSASTPAPDRSASQWFSNAGHHVSSATKATYEGTKTAANDTAITTKVKLGLHNDKLTHDNDIHVATHAGVVALRGSVRSPQDASRAVSIARSTTGARGVVNDLVYARQATARTAPEVNTQVE